MHFMNISPHFLDLKRNPEINIEENHAFQALELLEKISLLLFEKWKNTQPQ